MKELSKEDIKKLHDEINLYKNQSFAIRLAAVSVVGLVLALITNTTKVPDFRTLDIAYLIATALLVFLLLLYFLYLTTFLSTQKCASYLRHTWASQWENDHAAYLSLKRHTSLELLIWNPPRFFTLLGAVASLWPAILAVFQFQADSISAASSVHVFAVLVYFALMLRVLPRYVRRELALIEELWTTVLSAKPRQ